MATDYRDYFDARITRELETNDSSYGASKFEELQRASQEKVASLQELRRQRERIEAANRKSLVGQLGLDRDSFVGEAVDVGVPPLSKSKPAWTRPMRLWLAWPMIVCPWKPCWR